MTRNGSAVRRIPQKHRLHRKTYLDLLAPKPSKNAFAKFVLDGELSGEFRDIAV
jgi:hypothetical protein